jgi:hypothetical protein
VPIELAIARAKLVLAVREYFERLAAHLESEKLAAEELAA